MRKLIMIVALAGMLLAIPAQAAEFNRNLKYGVRKNTDVTKLQEFLSDEGLYNGPITGNFFSLTLSAVKAFQRRENLPATGFVGALTRERLNILIDAQLADASAEEMASGETVEVTQPTTNEDVVAKLQDQINNIQTQNQLLQQQLTQQQTMQDSLNQLVENTTIIPPAAPAPTPVPVLNPDLTIARSIGLSNQDSVQIKAVDDDFKIEAMVLVALNVDARQKIREGWRMADASLNFSECQVMDIRFAEQGSSLPVPCPGKNIRTAEDYANAPEVGFVTLATNWAGQPLNSTPVILKGQTRTMYVPTGTRIEYIKATGQSSGTVELFSNL